jgi:hypothetical protein
VSDNKLSIGPIKTRVIQNGAQTEFKRRRTMIKSGLGYLKWAPMMAALAMALILSMRSSSATTTEPLDADLRNEEAIIARYADDLLAYDKECALVGKKARLVSADLDGLERKSNDLKRRLAEVQNALREVVRKLKAANEWDSFETTIEAKITDARQRALFREFRFKERLEEDASSLTSRASEVDLPLAGLRKKLTSRFVQGGPMLVQAGYFEPAIRVASLRCRILTHRNTMDGNRGGSVSAQSQDAQACACNPDYTAGPNGNACAQTTMLWPVNDGPDGVRAAESQ